MTEYEMSAEDVIGACEAMLFVTDEALSALSISEMLGIAPARVQAALDELRRRLEARDAGIQLREAAGGWRLFTHPRYHDLIERYVIS